MRHNFNVWVAQGSLKEWAQRVEPLKQTGQLEDIQ